MSELDRERGPRLDLTFGTANLASDLEWVLQSSQVDAALVAEALLHSFYTPITQIARALEPAVAHESPLIIQAFVAALQHRYRFRSGMDTARWFYGTFVSSLPKVTRKDAWPPLAVALYTFSGLNPGQIAQLLPASPKEVKTLLYQLNRNPEETLQQAGWDVDESFGLELKKDWRAAFNERFPAMPAGEETLEMLAGEIAQQAERQGFLYSRLLTLREMVLIGLAILVVISILLAANRLFPAAEPENAPAEPTRMVMTQVVTGLVTREAGLQPPGAATPSVRTRRRWPTPTPVYPAQLPLPLSTQSNSFGIRERIKMSPKLYHTVWADVSMTFFGGAIPSGAPQRMQVWISDNQLRVVSGSVLRPRRIWVGNEYPGVGKTIQVRGARNRNLILTMEDVASFKQVAAGELRLLTNPLYPPMVEWGAEVDWDFRVVGTETVANRSAIIVDQVSPEGERVTRLWLDRDTAFVLRSRHYQPGRPENLVFELKVNDIRFDIDFVNQSLFRRLSASPVAYADGPFSTQPGDYWPVVTTPAASTPLPPPPAGFDPGPQPLEFIYPDDFDMHEAEIPVEISANGYSLGRVDFGNPWMMVCNRSQDGLRIAFSSRSLLSGRAMNSVGWFDLSNLSQFGLRILRGVWPSQLAFSPDGHMLAAFGNGMQGLGVYIAFLDEPDEIIFYPEQETPEGLVWNPDSRYLAWVTNPHSQGRQLTIVSHFSDQPVYKGGYTTEPIPSEDSLLEKWQVPLPTPTGGLEDCLRQPPPTS